MKKVADYLITKLKAKGFRIHRYDSVSTCSIYLKLDYGVVNSIRTSDHKGKAHLQYRYNVVKNGKGKTHKKSPQGCPRYYYGLDSLNVLIKDITYARTQKIKQDGQGNYELFMKRNKNTNKAGFWKHCKEM